MTIVIDNGTCTIKYGIAGTQPRTKENILYKSRHNYSFVPSKDSYIKKMFVNNIPVNYDVLEGTLDCLFSELAIAKVDDIVLTVGVCTPKIVKREITEMLFEVYNARRVQLGVDSVYSYLHNVKDRNKCDIIVSSSHSETHLVRMDRLDDVVALPYGGERARAYYNALLRPKNIRKTEFYVRVARDYRREALSIYDKLRSRDLNGSYVLEEKKNAENMKINVKKALEKRRLRKKEMEDGDVAETEDDIDEEGNDEEGNDEEGNDEEGNDESEDDIDEEENDENDGDGSGEEENDDDIDEEENDENDGDGSGEEENDDDIDEEENINESDGDGVVIDNSQNADEDLEMDERSHVPQVNGQSVDSAARRNRMVYFSAIYRNKQKIEKCLMRMRDKLTQMEDLYFKMSEPERYLENMKERFFVLRARIQEKENLKRKLKNKRSKESALLSKVANMNENEQFFTKEEAEIIEKINDIDHEDGVYEEKYQNLLNEIYRLDPSFEFLDFNTVEIMNGDHMGLTLSNTESLRVGEAVFNPSIMNCSLPGLSEMIENAFQTIGKEQKSVNVFVTGGFSQIDGFFERVVSECTMNAYGAVKFIKAQDPILDAFHGASFCEHFPVITREMYREDGLERLFE